MKKIIAILLSITCLLGVFPVFAAEAETDSFDLNYTLSSSANAFYFYAELLEAYFAKGESPSANSIINFLHLDVDYLFEEYIVPGEDDYFTTYNIPTEEFEELVFSYFTETETITNTLRSSHYYVADGGYYEITTGGGFGDLIPDFNYYGYEKQADGTYVAYAMLTSQYVDYVEYVPSEDEVFGVDYIYQQNTWIPDADNWSGETIQNVDVNHGYVPTKLVGYIKSEMVLEEITYDGETLTVATISSYEKIEGEGYPSSDSIVIYDGADDDALYSNVLTAYIYGACITFDESSFDLNTVITSKIITNGENYEKATAALDLTDRAFVVYDITATLDGQAVQPDAPTKVLFAIPETFAGDYALYSISDDGTAVEIEYTTGTVNDIEYITADLPSCSTYILTGTPDTEAINTAVHYTLAEAAEKYYYQAEPGMGYFAEGGSPDAQTLMMFLYEILVWPETGDYTEVRNIPADEFEAAVFEYFTPSESILATLRASSYYNADGNYYEVSSLGANIYEYSDFAHYGFEQREDGSYVTYATLTRSQIWDHDLIDYVDYVPGENDVEGIDYIYVPASQITDYESDTLDNVEIIHGYVPVKIDGYIKSVMNYDGSSNSATITSYEKVTGEGLPSSDSIVLFEQSEEEKVFEEAINTMIYGSYVSFDEESFDKKTVVSSTKVTEGEIYEKATAALEGVSNDLSIFDITAMLDGASVQPNAPVKVMFAMPDSFGNEVVLYHVAEDGTLEEIECTVDHEYRIVTAYLSHFSIYVLADVSSYVPADVNADGAVDTKDITRLMKYLAGEEVSTQVTDINGDGATDTKDLTRLMKYIAGQDVEVF